ncbi:hypothetical protein POTOM_059525 [Populus tomentosa]|uniref:Uncharacterized protein n=1 Tax=Populus tomentosa TaxID=118781 RepID=A0A8X8C266_POPTO|nr:hypothetical protein POTOM_059525 [Populus tomentosa]
MPEKLQHVNRGNIQEFTDLRFKKTRNPIQRALLMIDGFSNTVHFRVRKLKNLLDMVISKNASKFSSSREFELLAACDAQASSASSPTFSAGNGDAIDIRSYLFCNSEYSWI